MGEEGGRCLEGGRGEGGGVELEGGLVDILGGGFGV